MFPGMETNMENSGAFQLIMCHGEENGEEMGSDDWGGRESLLEAGGQGQCPGEGTSALRPE